MYITKEMQKDFEEKCTWIPHTDSLVGTLEAVSDALSEAGYGIQIIKIN